MRTGRRRAEAEGGEAGSAGRRGGEEGRRGGGEARREARRGQRERRRAKYARKIARAPGELRGDADLGVALGVELLQVGLRLGDLLRHRRRLRRRLRRNLCVVRGPPLNHRLALGLRHGELGAEAAAHAPHPGRLCRGFGLTECRERIVSRGHCLLTPPSAIAERGERLLAAAAAAHTKGVVAAALRRGRRGLVKHIVHFCGPTRAPAACVATAKSAPRLLRRELRAEMSCRLPSAQRTRRGIELSLAAKLSCVRRRRASWRAATQFLLADRCPSIYPTAPPPRRPRARRTRPRRRGCRQQPQLQPRRTAGTLTAR